ncbi:hypothetical protein F2Q70_00020880 [Brassica cretica]|uniref:Uncharacterized protein n=1 Tax=Brassica cretica TaxID=69181 RepID=A0A8S9GTK2_BRACR|nr:hypothetical protein F2Q70_00020880 [Brassica cretica]
MGDKPVGEKEEKNSAIWSFSRRAVVRSSRAEQSGVPVPATEVQNLLCSALYTQDFLLDIAKSFQSRAVLKVGGCRPMLKASCRSILKTKSRPMLKSDCRSILRTGSRPMLQFYCRPTLILVLQARDLNQL